MQPVPSVFFIRKKTPRFATRGLQGNGAGEEPRTDFFGERVPKSRLGGVLVFGFFCFIIPLRAFLQQPPVVHVFKMLF